LSRRRIERSELHEIHLSIRALDCARSLLETNGRVIVEPELRLVEEP